MMSQSNTQSPKVMSQSNDNKYSELIPSFNGLKETNFDVIRWRQNKLERSISGAMHGRWSRGRKARGQGHKKNQGQGLDQEQPFQGQTLSRPRTGMLEAKAKDTGASVLRKKGLQKSFSGEKGLIKFFSDNLQLRKTNKGLRKFSARFLAFSNKKSSVQK